MKLDKQIEIRIHRQFGLCNALRNKEQYLRIIGTIIQYVTKIEEQNEYTMNEIAKLDTDWCYAFHPDRNEEWFKK